MSEPTEDIYAGRFIVADDLEDGQEITLTISGTAQPGTEKAADGQEIKQGLLKFEKTNRALILGKTSHRILKSLFGPAANWASYEKKWIGREITLIRRYLPNCFGEKNVPVLRIKPDPEKPLPMGVRKHLGTEKPKL
jgi:hypothetical protein